MDEYEDAEIIDLRECFRCGDSIVQASNRLIESNAEYLCQPMLGATGRSGYVGVVPGRCAHIGAKIKSLLQTPGLVAGDIAVLARRHKSLRRLGWRLDEMGVPNIRRDHTLDIMRSDAFLDLLAMFRLICNRRDNVAFLRLALGRYIPLGAGGIDAIRRDSAREGLPYAEVALDPGTPSEPILRALLESYGPEAQVGEAAQQISDSLLEPNSGPTKHGQIGRAIRFWGSRWFMGGEMPIQKALEIFSTMQIDKGDYHIWDPGQVNLMTIHAAKGLEWPVVIVLEANEGELPLPAHRSDLLEERRVMYVAMTRARDTLLIHFRKAEHVRGHTPQPSRFIREALDAPAGEPQEPNTNKSQGIYAQAEKCRVSSDRDL